MIKLWDWIVRFFHRKRIAEIDRIEQMYGSEDGLEKRLEEIYDRYNHLNAEMPGEAQYKPGDPKPSALTTTNIIDGVKEMFPSDTPVQKRIEELLKEKPESTPRRHDEI